MEEQKTETTVATPATDPGKTGEPSHESKKPEREGRTEAEKAAYTLRMNAKRVRELGGNPDEILGIKPKLNVDESISDDTPLTVGALREIQKQDAKKTALQLAEEIEDDDEKEEVKEIIERLSPSGNPHADLALARAAVNATRTGQIAEEVNRKTKATRTAAGGSASARTEEPFVPTAEELSIFRLTPNITPEKMKERILAARKKSQKE